MEGRNTTTYLLQLPRIGGLTDLANHLAVSEHLIATMWRREELFYHQARIPKANGSGMRVISCPAESLKAVQAWILRSILGRLPAHHAATAYSSGSSIVHNAHQHQYHFHIACLDIKDFFGTIRYDRVYGVFRAVGYQPRVAHLLTSLCTHGGVLPQGGVTSPALSNLVCLRLDRRISRYCGALDVVYTRYADDMCLSSNDPAKLIACKRMAQAIISDEGFEVNPAKTRVVGPRNCRRVTGLILGDQSIGIGRKRTRLLRAVIHRYESGGVAADEMPQTLQQIHGRMAFLRSVDAAAYNRMKAYWDIQRDRYR